MARVATGWQRFRFVYTVTSLTHTEGGGRNAQHSTAQHSTAQHSTAQHSTVLYLKPGKLCAFLQRVSGHLKSSLRKTKTGLACVVCAVVLLPCVANAMPDCLPSTTQQFIGGRNPDTNTYVTPFANPAIGDFIGAVQTINTTVRCKFNSGFPSAGIYYRPAPGIYPAGFSAKHGTGGSAQVYTTSALAARGIGFTILTTDFFPYFSGQGGGFGGYSTNPQFADGDGYHSLSFQIGYRFIKINNNFAFGSTGALSDIPFDIMRYSVSEGNISGQLYIHQLTSPVVHGVSVTIPMMTVARRTCMTPYAEDGIVRLPTITPDALPMVGSTGSQVAFNLRMSCPPHLGYVGYYLVPVHGIVNASQGVIAINPNSQAQGIGLKLEMNAEPEPYLDRFYPVNSTQLGASLPVRFGAGNTYKFSQSYFKDAFLYGPPYNPQAEPLTASDEFRTIPIRVSVYRTGTVVPGTFNAAIWVYIVYK